MVERDVISRILTSLEEYLRDVDEIKFNSTLRGFLDDKVTRRYAERTLQLTIEACLDIAQHIISYQGLREPLDNKDCFKVLFEAGIIPETLSERLMKMAQFRNIVVHDYLKINPEIVFTIIQKDISDITAFAKIIAARFIEEI